MIAYIQPQEQGQSDLLLEQVARRLMAEKLDVAGIVQINTDNCKNHKCDMDVKVLPNGQTIRISQSLGAEAKGCRLDPDALETAIAQVQQRMTPDTDILLLNKFGKHEADGRGFRDLIAEAISLDIPIVTSVNPMNLEAFLEFAGDFAAPLDPCVATVTDWVIRACAAPDLAQSA